MLIELLLPICFALGWFSFVVTKKIAPKERSLKLNFGLSILFPLIICSLLGIGIKISLILVFVSILGYFTSGAYRWDN